MECNNKLRTAFKTTMITTTYKNTGFGYIELVVALAILSLIMLSSAYIYKNVVYQNLVNKRNRAEIDFSTEVFAKLRSLDYFYITNKISTNTFINSDYSNSNFYVTGDFTDTRNGLNNASVPYLEMLKELDKKSKYYGFSGWIVRVIYKIGDYSDLVRNKNVSELRDFIDSNSDGVDDYDPSIKYSQLSVDNDSDYNDIDLINGEIKVEQPMTNFKYVILELYRKGSKVYEQSQGFTLGKDGYKGAQLKFILDLPANYCTSFTNFSVTFPKYFELEYSTQHKCNVYSTNFWSDPFNISFWNTFYGNSAERAKIINQQYLYPIPIGGKFSSRNLKVNTSSLVKVKGETVPNAKIEIYEGYPPFIGTPTPISSSYYADSLGNFDFFSEEIAKKLKEGFSYFSFRAVRGSAVSPFVMVCLLFDKNPPSVEYGSTGEPKCFPKDSSTVQGISFPIYVTIIDSGTWSNKSFSYGGPATSGINIGGYDEELLNTVRFRLYKGAGPIDPSSTGWNNCVSPKIKIEKNIERLTYYCGPRKITCYMLDSSNDSTIYFDPDEHSIPVEYWADIAGLDCAGYRFYFTWKFYVVRPTSDDTTQIEFSNFDPMHNKTFTNTSPTYVSCKILDNNPFFSNIDRKSIRVTIKEPANPGFSDIVGVHPDLEYNYETNILKFSIPDPLSLMPLPGQTRTFEVSFTASHLDSYSEDQHTFSRTSPPYSPQDVCNGITCIHSSTVTVFFKIFKTP